MGQVITLKTRRASEKQPALAELKIPPQPTVVEYLDAQESVRIPDVLGTIFGVLILLWCALVVGAVLYAVEALLGAFALLIAIVALLLVGLFYVLIIQLFFGHWGGESDPTAEDATQEKVEPPPPRAA